MVEAPQAPAATIHSALSGTRGPGAMRGRRCWASWSISDRRGARGIPVTGDEAGAWRSAFALVRSSFRESEQVRKPPAHTSRTSRPHGPLEGRKPLAQGFSEGRSLTGTALPLDRTAGVNERCPPRNQPEGDRP